MSVLVQKIDGGLDDASPTRMSRSASSPATQARGPKYLYVKGAPEQVLERCSKIRFSKTGEAVPLTPKLRESISKKISEWAVGEALRVLGFATIANPQISERMDPSQYVKVETDMTFIGLIGMLDPPRPEVFDAIVKCRRAGVRVILKLIPN
jgi:Ca2+ transporting ATPase